MTATDIEIACAKHFNLRQNIIVPNVSWGLGLHECDLLILTKSGYAYEVEIKVSMSDLKADLKKKHGHNHQRIKKLYFAVPSSLYPECEKYIPERAGIITVRFNKYDYCIRSAEGFETKYKIYLETKIKREAKTVGEYKFTNEERLHLAHLGTMRVWSMKQAQRNKIWEKEIEDAGVK